MKHVIAMPERKTNDHKLYKMARHRRKRTTRWKPVSRRITHY